MFGLAEPWILILIPIPLLIWFFIPRANLQLATAVKVPFFDSMVNLIEQEKSSIIKHTKINLLWLIWALLIFALAGPRWVGAPQPLQHEGYNILLALDISGSMELNDMLLHGRPATRLAVVKRAAIQFVDERVGDKLGLILFGTRAYLQTPLTLDRHAILMRIEDATVGLAGNSTSIGDALGLAIKRLQTAPKQGRFVILLTDGANNSGFLSPMKAAELASQEGIRVYTIGLGSDVDPASFGSLFLNMNAGTDLDEDTLKQVAEKTGGRYFRATDSKSLQQIYAMINQLETVPQDKVTVRPQHDYYPWPLAIALMLFVYWLASQGGLLSDFYYRVRREGVE